MIIDVQHYYGKLARNESLSEEEVIALLKAVEGLQQGLGYLASCQAATLEGLPRSTSKTSLNRHVTITRICSEVMAGNLSSIRYPERYEAARERCIQAVAACAERK